jgi:hypothetical protein
LTTFDEFAADEIFTEYDIQDYHSMYIDLYNELRKTNENAKENVNDDGVFEMELIKQVEINIDYVLSLVKKYHQDHTKNREILIDINKAIDSSVELRNKKDLINQFITSLDVHSVVDDDWQKFVEQKKVEELDHIIEKEGRIIPIEIKSGFTGRMKSLFMFISKYNSETALKISQAPYKKDNQIVFLPFYAIESFLKKDLL